MGSWCKLVNVREIQILSDQKTIILLNGFPNFLIRFPIQFLVKNCVDIMAYLFEEID